VDVLDASSLPTPSLAWLGIGKDTAKPGPLPAYQSIAIATVKWQVALGVKGGANFAPAVLADAFTRRSRWHDHQRRSGDRPAKWRIKADMPLQAGVGASLTTVAVGTQKVKCWPSTTTAKRYGRPGLERSRRTPKAAEGRSWSGRSTANLCLRRDRRRQKWAYQRLNPSLTVRRFVGGTLTRGALFTGTVSGNTADSFGGGLNNGTLGWEANVATPKGATELERIADVTSLPVVDGKQVCAVAFQGRVACFELQRGTLLWSRDFSSLAGLELDEEYLYLTDDKGSVHALDKATGASLWKQDKLAARFPSGPARVGAYVGIVDGEGYLHLLDPRTGALVGRVATDGTAALAQPYGDGDVIVWQSAAGNLFSVGAR
jgi:outer membrane protein assembly factor BamB